MDFLVRSHTSQGALIELLPVPQDVVLSRVCRALAEVGVRNMDFISSYIDSLVSYGQLQTWVEDIPRFLDSAELSSAEVGIVREMLRLAHDAIRRGGYLYIEGDTGFNVYTEIRHQEP